jgi:hypothetical protein
MATRDGVKTPNSKTYPLSVVRLPSGARVFSAMAAAAKKNVQLTMYVSPKNLIADPMVRFSHAFSRSYASCSKEFPDDRLVYPVDLHTTYRIHWSGQAG